MKLAPRSRLLGFWQFNTIPISTLGGLTLRAKASQLASFLGEFLDSEALPKLRRTSMPRPFVPRTRVHSSIAVLFVEYQKLALQSLFFLFLALTAGERVSAQVVSAPAGFILCANEAQICSFGDKTRE